MDIRSGISVRSLPELRMQEEARGVWRFLLAGGGGGGGAGLSPAAWASYSARADEPIHLHLRMATGARSRPVAPSLHGNIG